MILDKIGKLLGTLIGILFLISLFQRWFIFSSRKKVLLTLTENDFPNVDKDKYISWRTAEIKSYNIFIYFMKGFIYSFLIMIVFGLIGGIMHIAGPPGILMNIFLLLFWGGVVIILIYRVKAHILKRKAGVIWPIKSQGNGVT